MSNEYYYIASGKLNAMYTLRVSRFEDEKVTDNYWCNLAVTWDKALAKAQLKTGGKLGNLKPFDLDPISRNRVMWEATLAVYNPETMPTGKHAGMAWDKLVEENPAYVKTMIDWLSGGGRFSGYTTNQCIVLKVKLILAMGENYYKNYVNGENVRREAPPFYTTRYGQKIYNEHHSMSWSYLEYVMNQQYNPQGNSYGLTPSQQAEMRVFIALLLEDILTMEKEPVPETDKRVQITGLVLGVRHYDTAYGRRYVVTVLDDRGFKVEGSQFRVGGYCEISGLDHYSDDGDRVTFMARVYTTNDPYKGEFKRPTKGKVIG